MKKKGMGLALLISTVATCSYVLGKRGRHVMAEGDFVPQEIQRLSGYYDIQTQWIKNLQNKKRVDEYFNEYGMKRIAIYGKGKLGIALYQELKKSDIEVAYFIDSMVEEKSEIENGLYVVPLTDLRKEKKVDAIVVTPTFEIQLIKKEIKHLTSETAIVGLNEVVYFLPPEGENVHHKC